MIEHVDQVLRKWAGTVAGDIAVSLSLEEKIDADTSISLCLMDILSMPMYGQGRRLPLQVRLRYLVSTQANNVETAHEILGKLLFSAMEKPEFEVDLESVDMVVWQAFGIVPRPAFYLILPMRVERENTTKLIRTPPELVYQKMRDLDGVVMGPGNIPVPNGRIKLADLGRSVTADEQGRFHLGSIPAKPSKRQFFISAKGQDFELEARLPEEGKLLLLHLQAMEV